MNPNDLSRFCFYRVLHGYSPPDDYLNKGYLVIEEDDVIQVSRPVDLEQGTEENPEGWLMGKNTRNNVEGYFPSGEYVRYIAENQYVTAGAPLACQRRHSTAVTYFVRPILCACCQDYIWGCGVIGVICRDCGQCFHKECESIAVSFEGCRKQPPQQWPPVHDRLVALAAWDAGNVADWMAVVNLYRYAHIFLKYGVNGSGLPDITVAMLKGMKIEDDFHQKSVLACIKKLCSAEKAEPSPLVQPEGASKNDHRFVIYSFSTMQPCHLCGEFLWGLIQQGYQCRDCGLCSHRKCAVGNLPRCHPDKLKNVRRGSFTQGSVFGLPLSEQFSISSTMKAPPIIVRFTTELEKRAQEKGIKAVDAYRSGSSTVDLNRLKRCVSEGNIETANLDSFDHVCIAGALKKYLRDLPNAIIHEDFFDQFVQGAKIEDDELCKRTLLKLVDELPIHHCTTLKYLMGHFVRCIRQQITNDDNMKDIKDAVSKLCRVFYQIIMRPPWRSIMEIVFNAESGLRVLQLLILADFQLERKKPPPTPINPTDTYKRYSGNVEKADWYWKDISKEELTERMSNTQDGTFLVRDSSDGVKNNYTVAVRKGGSNRLVKIYHRDGKFGLMEPLVFNSVVDLINYYSSNSLSHFNKTLDTILTIPVCRPVVIVHGEDVKKLKEDYIKADKDYNDEAKKFEILHEEHTNFIEDLQVRNQALDAFKETIVLFEENRKIVMRNERLVPQSELGKAKDNFDLLKRQMKAVAERYARLESEVKQLAASSKAKFKEMNAMKPDLQSKGEHRDQLRQKLISCGETPRMLEELVMNQEENGSTVAENTSHLDETTWLLNCERNHAENLLAGKPDGTFLIRPRRESDFPYGLSIVSNGAVSHCKIGKKDTGYGFADPFFIHETLTDLVMHYKDTSLVEHNDKIDVMLDFPVLGTVFSKPGDKRIRQLQNSESRSSGPPAVPSRLRRDDYQSYVG